MLSRCTADPCARPIIHIISRLTGLTHCCAPPNGALTRLARCNPRMRSWFQSSLDSSSEPPGSQAPLYLLYFQHHHILISDSIINHLAISPLESSFGCRAIRHKTNAFLHETDRQHAFKNVDPLRRSTTTRAPALGVDPSTTMLLLRQLAILLESLLAVPRP